MLSAAQVFPGKISYKKTCALRSPLCCELHAEIAHLVELVLQLLIVAAGHKWPNSSR